MTNSESAKEPFTYVTTFHLSIWIQSTMKNLQCYQKKPCGSMNN
nr:MAG TPA: hypothetical protein [Caudoviricetes sp.]